MLPPIVRRAPTDPNANLKALLVPVLRSSHASVTGVSNMVHLRFHGMLSRADPASLRITLFVGSGDVNGQMQVRCRPDARLCQRSMFMTVVAGELAVCVFDNQVCMVTSQRLAGHIFLL